MQAALLLYPDHEHRSDNNLTPHPASFIVFVCAVNRPAPAHTYTAFESLLHSLLFSHNCTKAQVCNLQPAIMRSVVLRRYAEFNRSNKIQMWKSNHYGFLTACRILLDAHGLQLTKSKHGFHVGQTAYHKLNYYGNVDAECCTTKCGLRLKEFGIHQVSQEKSTDNVKA